MSLETPVGSVRDVYVFPGRVIATREVQRLTTVLGSCVSVCLFDPRARIGGMNHYLLPDGTGDSSWSLRFARPATQQLIEQLLALGADRNQLVAKVFGGSVTNDSAKNGFHVGFRNVEAARRILSEDRIRVVAEDVGGRRGRKIVFRTDDGAAFVKWL